MAKVVILGSGWKAYSLDGARPGLAETVLRDRRSCCVGHKEFPA